MNLRFAFAVNNNGNFEKKHFGFADKYLIYEQISDKIVLSGEETNKFKLIDKEHEHGSKKKGEVIIKFLREKEVNVLVSMKFGNNIKMVNKYFIPVIIYSEKTEEVINVLSKQLHWIKDEWENKSSDFKLFTIKSGILKSSIKK